MKFFVIRPATLKDLYARLTEDQDPGPDGIDPAVKKLIAAWEEKVSKTMRGARKLLGSQTNVDPEVIRRYISLMEHEVGTIQRVCSPHEHPVFKKLIQAEEFLQLLTKRLRAKIESEKKPS